MKVFIFVCLLAVASANPWTRWFNWGPRPGICPPHSQLSVETLEAANRCQVDHDENPLDRTCDADGEETYKCCEYETGIRVCIQPINAPEYVPVDVSGSLFARDRNQTEEEQISEAVRKTRDFIVKLSKYAPPEEWKLGPQSPETIRWCVTSWCEKKKCKRMAAEFTYSPDMVPRKEWKCMKAESPEQCMFWIEQGWADIMTTRQRDVFTANRTFDLKPIAYESAIMAKNSEILSLKHYQNVTFALKSARHSNPNSWAELRDKTTCHAGANMPASFEAPALRLIKEGIIPHTGDYVESFADFVQESCIPGVLNKTFDKNGTYPKNLISLCGDQELQYSGILGSLMCLDSGKGQVTFLDHKTIKTIMDDDDARDDYMVVCRDESRNLDEDIFTEQDCHVGYTAHPTIFISKNNTVQKEAEIKTLLQRAMEVYGDSDPMTQFNIFDSSVYECETDPKTGEPMNKNLLFLEESNMVRMIDHTKVYAEKVFEEYKLAETLLPKPRAKMCVTTPHEYEACLRFKDLAEKFPEVNHAAWGCVLRNSSMECMQAVHNNMADLYKADPKETFIAGKEFMLDPLMSVHRNDSVTEFNHTFTRTLAVMKVQALTKFDDLLMTPESEPMYIKDFWKLKICSAGLENVSAFHNPIGWLLANGTIPRIGSVFESVHRYFNKVCIAGVEPETWRWDSDLLIGHELNWGFPYLNMYNFTGEDWFTWNTPATWDYLTYNLKSANLEKLLSRPIMNLTLSNLKDALDRSPVGERLLHELKGIDGLEYMTEEDMNDIVSTASDSECREQTQTSVKDQISQAFSDARDQEENPLAKKIKHISKLVESRKATMNSIRERLDLPPMDMQFNMPLVTSQFRNVMGLKADKIDTLEDIMTHFKSIPTLKDFDGGRMGDIFEHPAVRSYLQTYYPNFANSFVEMFDNSELREREFNRYTNPLWLSPQLKNFLDIVEDYQTKIANRCANARPTLDVAGYDGSLRCLKACMADVIFLDEQTLRDESQLSRVGYTYNDLRLLCPNGQVVRIDANLDVAKVCNFGEVMNPALVVAYNTSGSWRWNVTKALMHAHQSPAYAALFGPNTLMGRDYNKLLPVSPVDQTYQTYLGPMALRSYEAIIKPSSYDWFKDQTAICYGETYTNVIKQRNGTCQAVIKDVTCVGEPKMKKISVGRFGQKQYKIVKMCSRPSKFVSKMAEFTCDNGYGYLKPVVTAIACECMPCEEMIEFNASFTDSVMWKNEDNKYTFASDIDPFRNITIWGNSDFWYNHTKNRNFELGNKTVMVKPISERHVGGVLSQLDPTVDPAEASRLDTAVVKKTCEAVWHGRSWNREWFPRPANNGTDRTCVAPNPIDSARSRLERFRQTILNREN